MPIHSIKPADCTAAYLEKAEQSSPRQRKIQKRLTGEERQKFLDHLRASTHQYTVPLFMGNKVRSTDIQAFQQTTAFSILITETTDTLKMILNLTYEVLGQKKGEALQKALGTMLNRMQVPKSKNPWFYSQDTYNQRDSHPYSMDEILHAYENTCHEIQILGKLIHAAVEGRLGITTLEAKKEISPFLEELPTLISVCGAGSLINIQDTLNNLQQQLLPGSIHEQFDLKTEKIVMDLIQDTLRSMFQNDPSHPINEIHRVSTVRYMAGELLDIKKTSIKNDIYATGFLSELNSPDAIREKSIIQNEILTTIRSAIYPEKICTYLAQDYIERIKEHIKSQGIDVKRIPYTSDSIKKAMELLDNEYGHPPENYLLEDVERKDYSKCITNSHVLLATWFLHTLSDHKQSISDTLRTIQEKTTKTQTINHHHQKLGTISTDVSDKVYQTNFLVWANAKNPKSGHAEKLRVENLSEEFIKNHIERKIKEKNTFDIFAEAVINTSSYIINSDEVEKDAINSLKTILNLESLKELGLSNLSKIPIHLMSTEDKITGVFMSHLAGLDSPEKSPLTKIIIDESNLTNLSGKEEELKKGIIDFTINMLESNPELASHENIFALDLMKKLFINKFHRTGEMQKYNKLIEWAIHKNNTNIIDLTIKAYKEYRPIDEVQDTLNRPFSVRLTESQKKNVIFHEWPEQLKNLRTSALGAACITNNLSLLKVLLKEKLNPNTEDVNGYTPLSYAAAYGSKEMVEYLIQNGARLDGANIPPILAATIAERIDIIETLSKNKANINQPNTKNQLTALHVSYITGNIGMAKKLYEMGAQHGQKARLFNMPSDSSKRTAFEMVEHALKKDRNCHSKIHRAERNIKLAQMYVFHHIQHGIPFDNKILMHGYPLVHALTYQQNTEALKMVFDSLSTQPEQKEMLLNARSSWASHKKTPLMVAAKQGALEVAEYLISQPETDLLLTDRKGRTALEIARKFDNSAIVELLSRKIRVTPPVQQTGLLQQIRSLSQGSALFGRFRRT
jgi:ankyrin repeat protein